EAGSGERPRNATSAPGSPRSSARSGTVFDPAPRASASATTVWAQGGSSSEGLPAIAVPRAVFTRMAPGLTISPGTPPRSPSPVSQDCEESYRAGPMACPRLVPLKENNFSQGTPGKVPSRGAAQSPGANCRSSARRVPRCAALSQKGKCRVRSRSRLRRGRHRFDAQLHAHPFDEHFHIEGLVHEIVGAGVAQFLDLVVFDHAADAQNADIFHVRVGTHALADFLPVDVR